MGKIVIIGGGNFSSYKTLELDRLVVKLTKKKKPKALFIPTASGEPQSYIDVFNNIYGKKLGCKTDTLYCLKGKPSKKKLREQILSSDIIYVGGGNTLKMMLRWKHLGIDKAFKEAYKRGTVLTGMSAGGICWFDSGHSDSRSFRNPNKWEYINVSGLGLVKGIHCPHYDTGTKIGGKVIPRKKHFERFMKKYSSMGIAVDEYCALEITNGTYRVHSMNKNVHAFKVYKKQGKVVSVQIPERKTYASISELYAR